MNGNVCFFNIVFLFIFVANASAQTQNLFENDIVKIRLQVYPKTICMGDTLFCQIFVSNKTEKQLGFFPMQVRGIYRSKSFLHYELIRNEKRYVGAFEQGDIFPSPRPDAPMDILVVEPGKSEIFESFFFQLPPLEDWYHPFWNEEMEEQSRFPEGLAYRLEMVMFIYHFTIPSSFTPEPIRLCDDIVLRLRPQQEIELIEKWYRNTPLKELPRLYFEADFIPGENPKLPQLKETSQYHIGISCNYPYKKVPREKRPLRQTAFEKRYLDEKPYVFLNKYDRFPGHPNLPKTWQQWKILENSFENGSMKDNVRLSRMFVQYEATQDTEVLQELKDWFDSMNEIQRGVMAKEIRSRMISIDTYNNNIDGMKDLQRQNLMKESIPEKTHLDIHRFYETIRKYDVTLKSPNERNRMKRTRIN